MLVDQYQNEKSTVSKCTETIPNVHMKVKLQNTIQGSAKVVQELFPLWKPNELQLSVCTTGLTNKLVKVTHKSGHVVLVRIYGRGTDVLIDREQELKNLMMLSSLGFCPGLYGYFDNGMVYGYVEGQVFTPHDMMDPHKSKLVAQHMASWHRINTYGSEPQLFSTMFRWLDLVPRRFSNQKNNLYFDSMGYTIDFLKKEAKVLQKRLLQFKSPIVFCHNDIQVANIIYNSNTDSVSFIDYEYGSVSFRGFDIGNHFCEFGGTSGDWTKFPEKEFRLKWLFHYASQDDTITVQDIDAMDKEVLGFALASHFFWSIWAFIQAEISDIEFHYLEYARSRLQEYFEKKESWLP